MATNTASSLIPGPRTQAHPCEIETPAYVDPTPQVMNKFWKRVAEVTTRYHDANHQWIGQIFAYDSEEHDSHLTGMQQMFAVQAAPGSLKLGCSRKDDFVFDMTKDNFFPSREQFTEIFKKKDTQQLRRHKQSENTFRNSYKSTRRNRTLEGQDEEDAQIIREGPEQVKPPSSSQKSIDKGNHDHEGRLLEEKIANTRQVKLLAEDIMRRSCKLHEKTLQLKNEIQPCHYSPNYSTSDVSVALVEQIVHEIHELWSLAETAHKGC
ncbi:hypothetical protein C8J57DRAFT_1546947 [Mycena rebaudengoi]|nr:hypothetical protein C8J57DRAFT_1546947 [Mycena rebaudengoi]